MTETTQPKRRGRPPKTQAQPEFKSGPIADSRTRGEAVTGNAETVPFSVREEAQLTPAMVADYQKMGEVVRISPPSKMDVIPCDKFADDLRARIRECNEVYIVCKTIGPNGATVNHSRHDALWLKDYV